MTLQETRPQAIKVGAASLKHLRATISDMLEHGDEARIILSAGGDILGSNTAGASLAPAFQGLGGEERRALMAWLMHAIAKDFELKLQVGGKLAAYVLHKIPLAIEDSTNAYLIIARQPNLSGHLIQALSQSRALYKDIAESMPGMIWETRADGCFSFIGGRAIKGLDPLTLAQAMPSEALQIPDDVAAMVFLSNEAVESVDIWVSAPHADLNAGRVCLSVSAKPVLSKSGMWMGARGVAIDVTADRLESDAVDAASRQMVSKAETDALTGLLNRRGFEERLDKLCRQVRAADSGGYLALIDLDKFKQLNDTHGHAAGDAALIEVGNLLKRSIRREDIVGRLGGDEFVLWIDDASSDGMHRICDNLLSEMPGISDTIQLPGFGLGMSIGISRLKPGRDTLKTLMERADKTMYAVKAAGRGTYRFDDEDT